jgi:hypothetical protein
VSFVRFILSVILRFSITYGQMDKLQADKLRIFKNNYVGRSVFGPSSLARMKEISHSLSDSSTKKVTFIRLQTILLCTLLLLLPNIPIRMNDRFLLYLDEFLASPDVKRLSVLLLPCASLLLLLTTQFSVFNRLQKIALGWSKKLLVLLSNHVFHANAFIDVLKGFEGMFDDFLDVVFHLSLS